MYTYKTKNGLDSFLPGVGATTNGMITTDDTIENPNFELVEGQPEAAQQGIVATEAPQPNAVVDAAPVPPTEAPQPQPTNEETN